MLCEELLQEHRECPGQLRRFLTTLCQLPPSLLFDSPFNLGVDCIVLRCETRGGESLALLASRARKTEHIEPNGLPGTVLAFIGRHQFTTLTSGLRRKSTSGRTP